MARHPARVVLLACSLPVAACGTSDPALPLAPDVGEEPAEADPARGVRFVDIGASYAHTCALDDAGAAWCWGFNGDGRLGDGTTADRTVPTPVAGGHTFVSLGVGDAHTCGLRADGVVLCWGANVRGQLGDGDAPPPGDFGPVVFDSLPQPVAGDHRFASLSVGLHHACALEEDGSAYCWGANEMGQLGDGTFVDRDVPTPVAGGHRFASLHAGGLTCGFRLDSTLLCWGRDPSDCACEALPHRVAPGRAFTTVAVALHVCGLEADGRAFCWGENLSGQIGDVRVDGALAD
ncbi:MAG TPA: hypothetical protein VFQ22_02730, partial [Longimicrobiales bacterium]|nr:hypothetical protein [Longimicrobiales bacterium]